MLRWELDRNALKPWINAITQGYMVSIVNERREVHILATHRGRVGSKCHFCPT